ncbi:V-type proton ATPase subunit D [Nymphaea thermarum]|nr:V-type proton ATPase subunit D [Nymphaea thermarum]
MKILRSSETLAEGRMFSKSSNVKHAVLENVRSATLKVRSPQENVAGVKLPRFEYFSSPTARPRMI